MESLSIVVSAFGITTGVINTLLSTITAVEQRRREFREYNDRLRDYKTRLALVQMSIDAWKAIWGGFSHTTYRYFWTQDGFDEIQQWLRGLTKLTLDFESMLEDSSRLKLSLRQIQNALGQSEETNNTRISARVAFVLYKNNKLHDMVDSLEIRVRLLDEFTARMYRKQQKGKISERPTHAELTRSENLKVFMERFSQFAQTLHQFQNTLKNTKQWALELRFPDNKGNMMQWDRMEEIYLDFCLHVQGKGSDWCSKRIRIRYMSTTDPATILIQIIAAIREDFQWDKDSISLLDPSQRRSLPYKEIFSRGLLADDGAYKAWDKDRANLMFGFVNWMILFWNTSLIAQPCCCGLRFHDLNGSGRQHTLTISEEYHLCYDPSLTQRKFLMLGSVLIELTLAMPVKIELENDRDGIGHNEIQESRAQYVFYVRESGNNGWNRVTLPWVLQEISRKSYNSVQITNAIWYCFENSSDDIAAFRPFLIAHYVDEILKPVQEYSQLILDHTQQRDTMPWLLKWMRTVLDAQRGVSWPPNAVFEN